MPPCNVIVHEKNNGKIEIAAINPISSVQVIQSDSLKGIAVTNGAKLQNFVNSL